MNHSRASMTKVDNLEKNKVITIPVSIEYSELRKFAKKGLSEDTTDISKNTEYTNQSESESESEPEYIGINYENSEIPSTKPTDEELNIMMKVLTRMLHRNGENIRRIEKCSNELSRHTKNFK